MFLKLINAAFIRRPRRVSLLCGLNKNSNVGFVVLCDFMTARNAFDMHGQIIHVMHVLRILAPNKNDRLLWQFLELFNQFFDGCLFHFIYSFHPQPTAHRELNRVYKVEQWKCHKRNDGHDLWPWRESIRFPVTVKYIRQCNLPCRKQCYLYWRKWLLRSCQGIVGEVLTIQVWIQFVFSYS